MSSFDFRHGQIAVKLNEHFYCALVFMHSIARARARLVPSLDGCSQGTATRSRLKDAQTSMCEIRRFDWLTLVTLLDRMKCSHIGAQRFEIQFTITGAVPIKTDFKARKQERN